MSSIKKKKKKKKHPTETRSTYLTDMHPLLPTGTSTVSDARKDAENHLHEKTRLEQPENNTFVDADNKNLEVKQSITPCLWLYGIEVK